jgi:hypothetical protein
MSKLIVAIIITVYLILAIWTVASNDSIYTKLEYRSYTSFTFSKDSQDYYNMLSHSILNGHLDLGIKPSSQLLGLREPYEPSERNILHAGFNKNSDQPYYLYDASLYNKKYYIYFGVTPVLLFVQFRLLTGFDLPISLGILIFIIFGVSISTYLICKFNNFINNGSSNYSLYIGLLIFMYAQPTLILLRRTMFYELVFACAFSLFLILFNSIFNVIILNKNKMYNLCVIGLVLGLLVGCRPIYILFIPITISLFLLDLYIYKYKYNIYHISAFILPLICIGLMLIFYNLARFHNIFEFGQSYQLAGTLNPKKVHLFNYKYILNNLYAYLFSYPAYINHFPYINLKDFEPLFNIFKEPNIVNGYNGSSLVLGLITCYPIVILNLNYFNFNSNLSKYIIYLQISAFSMFGILLFYQGSTIRYMFDFSIPIFLLTVISYFYFELYYNSYKYLILTFRFVMISLIIYSFIINLLTSIELYGWYKYANPLGHSKTASLFEEFSNYKVVPEVRGNTDIRLLVKYSDNYINNIETLFTIRDHEKIVSLALLHLSKNKYKLLYIKGAHRNEPSIYYLDRNNSSIYLASLDLIYETNNIHEITIHKIFTNNTKFITKVKVNIEVDHYLVLSVDEYPIDIHSSKNDLFLGFNPFTTYDGGSLSSKIEKCDIY